MLAPVLIISVTRNYGVSSIFYPTCKWVVGAYSDREQKSCFSGSVGSHNWYTKAFKRRWGFVILFSRFVRSPRWQWWSSPRSPSSSPRCRSWPRRSTSSSLTTRQRRHRNLLSDGIRFHIASFTSTHDAPKLVCKKLLIQLTKLSQHVVIFWLQIY